MLPYALLNKCVGKNNDAVVLSLHKHPKLVNGQLLLKSSLLGDVILPASTRFCGFSREKRISDQLKMAANSIAAVLRAAKRKEFHWCQDFPWNKTYL